MKTDVNGSYVWTVKDGKAARKRVKITANSDESNPLVPIAEGLVAGTTVLTLRGVEPNEGQPVSMPGAAAGVAPAATVPPATASK